MCMNKRRIALATAGVFILLAVVYAITANNAYMRDHAQAVTKADDNRILYANDDFVRLFDCENLEDFNRFSLGLFRNLIHPEDFERVMKERRERFAGKNDGDQIRLRFRIVTKHGTVKEVIAQARLRHHDTFGDLHFVTCMDLDKELEGGPLDMDHFGN